MNHVKLGWNAWVHVVDSVLHYLRTNIWNHEKGGSLGTCDQISIIRFSVFDSRYFKQRKALKRISLSTRLVRPTICHSVYFQKNTSKGEQGRVKKVTSGGSSGASQHWSSPQMKICARHSSHLLVLWKADTHRINLRIISYKVPMDQFILESSIIVSNNRHR